MNLKKFSTLLLSFLFAAQAMAAATQPGQSSIVFGNPDPMLQTGPRTTVPGLAMMQSMENPEVENICQTLIAESAKPEYVDRRASGGGNFNYMPLYNSIHSTYRSFKREAIESALRAVNEISPPRLGFEVRSRNEAILEACRKNLNESLMRDKIVGADSQSGVDVGTATGEVMAAVADGDMMEACGVFRSEKCSTANSPLPADDEQFFTDVIASTERGSTETGNIITNFGNFFANNFSRPVACKCAKDLVEKNPRRKRKVEKEKEKLTGLIQNRLKNKFINEYAQNREDMLFLTNHRKQVFGATDAEINRTSESLLCNKESDFEAALTQPCEGNNVSASDKEKRKKELFEAMGIRPKSSLAENFMEMESKISSIPFTSRAKLPKGLNENFTRIELDKIRHGLSQEDTSIKSFSTFVTNILKDSAFKGLLRETINKSPAEIIKIYLDNLKDSEKAQVLNRLTAGCDNDFIRDFKADPSGQYSKTLSFATANVPGLRIALTKKAVFDRLMAKNKNVITALDTDTDILLPHLQELCGKAKKAFAQAVCNDPDKLISQARPEELDNLLAENKEGLDYPLARALACDAGNDQGSLDLEIDSPASSLLARLQNKPENFSNVMKLFADGDQLAIKYATYLALKNENTSRPVTSSVVVNSNNAGVVRASGGKTHSSIFEHVTDSGTISSEKVASSFATRSQQTEQATTESVANSATGTTKVAAELPSVSPNTSNLASSQAAVSSSVYSNVASNQAAAVTSNAARNRTELKETLASDNNREEVNSLVNNVSDEQVAQLNRLQNELKANEARLQELNGQIQANKLKELESQINDLERKKQDLSSQSRNLASDDSDEDGRSSGRTSVGSVQRDSSGALSNLGGGLSGDISSSSGAASSSSSGGAAAIKGGVGNQTLAANTGVNNVALFNAPLIVQATSIASSAPDLSVEVIKYIEANDPDLSVLTQIKEKGFLYKYKVVENGVEKQEEVLIQFDKLTPSARLALENKIAQRRTSNPALAQVEDKLQEVRRTYSYETLKLIMAQKAQLTYRNP